MKAQCICVTSHSGRFTTQHLYCLWLQNVLENLCRVTNRAPMQWSDGRFAGFTTGNMTWIRVSDDYHSVNVEVRCRRCLITARVCLEKILVLRIT